MCSVVYGAALLSHGLLGAGLSDTAKIGSGFSLESGTHTHTHTLAHIIRDLLHPLSP